MINELIRLGNMYKAAGYAFRESGDEGIEAFMRWEMMERYEAAEKLAEHLGGPVVLTAQPAPEVHGATEATLKALVAAEVAVIDMFDREIREAGNDRRARALTYARNYQQTQHDEVAGIVRQISRIAGDNGAMCQYNIFLAERFGEQYNGGED